MPRMALTTERPQPHAAPADRRRRYRADVQGLRAIAVLAVIADHLAGWPRGSFDGVDVFFVISGYLITGILVREFESRQTISFRHGPQLSAWPIAGAWKSCWPSASRSLAW
jgi:hypothetical protein